MTQSAACRSDTAFMGPVGIPMKSVTLQIDESTDKQLSLLSERFHTTPGHFIELLCESLDQDALEQVIGRRFRCESGVSGTGGRPDACAARDGAPERRRVVV